MKGKKIKLQVFFILLKIFNTLYYLSFPFFLKGILLKMAGIKVGRESVIQSGRFFSFGKLEIGSNSIINSGCYLDNRRGIFIGNNVVIAHDSKFYTLGHDYNDPTFRTKGASIRIEDYVIIFANAQVMPGVTIKKGAVILSGSVVTKDVDEMTVMGGNPARPVRRREILHTQKDAYKYWFSI